MGPSRIGVDQRDGAAAPQPWRGGRKYSEGGVDPDANGARPQRRHLLAAGRERRPQREAVAFCIGQVRESERQPEIVAADAHRQPGVEVVALRLAQLGTDPEPRLADVAGPGLADELEVRADRLPIVEPDAA